MSKSIALPELDAEIALQEAEDFAGLMTDVEAGRLDTASLSDIEDGDYPVEILDCHVRESKGKEGEIRYPNIVFRLREANDNFTTSVYWPISSGSPAGRKFLGERLVKTFQRLLGSEFKSVKVEQLTDPTKVLMAKVKYFGALAEKVVGKQAVATVATNDQGYKNLTTLAPRREA